MIDWSDYANFSEREFACKGFAKGLCSCGGLAKMDPQFMDKLQRTRNLFGRPMVVNSGYRCPEYNVLVSKKKTGSSGPHTTGRAADIKVASPAVVTLISAALAADMLGFGPLQHGPYRGRYLHLDDLRRRLWTYE
jgi:uncharacterized protein YcbK (DUF882 family)